MPQQLLYARSPELLGAARRAITRFADWRELGPCGTRRMSEPWFRIASRRTGEEGKSEPDPL